MNSENIYDAITNINDDFIVEIKDSKGKKAHWRILLVAAIITMLAAGTALATWFLRAPDEAAMQDPVLAAYLSLEGTVIINESIDDGDYRVTLLGIAQGDAIISLNIPDMPLIEPDSTYVITAVQKLDGSDMPLLTDSIFDRRFYAVAGIRGISPWEYLLSYGTMTVVTEGVYIMLTICDDLEPFADRGAYIVVSHEISFTGDAIIYDEITGEVKANEEYDGISVVFALPLDSSKADPERAEEIMQGWSRLPAEISIEIDKNMIDADGRFMFPSVDELAALPVDEARAKMAAVSILGSEWGYYLMQSPLEDFELMADHIMACTVVDGNIRYELNIEFEDGSGSAGVAYVPYEQVAEELGVAPYYIFSSSSHWGRDYETYHLMLFVFTQDDDGVIWFMPRTAAFATADMPREVIENYNQRVERGE